MSKPCELCGKYPDYTEPIFGVYLCPECTMIFNKAMKDDPQSKAILSNLQNFPNATNKAKKELLSLVAPKGAQENPPMQNVAYTQPYTNQGTQYYQTPPQPDVIYNNPTYTAPPQHSGFLDGLYTDIGGKLKSWAKWIFIVEAIASIISAFGLIFSGEDLLFMFTGFVLLFVGPIIAWVSSWILYAFGELIDKTTANEKNTREILKIMSENNSK